jgi:hypothetical protein
LVAAGPERVGLEPEIREPDALLAGRQEDCSGARERVGEMEDCAGARAVDLLIIDHYKTGVSLVENKDASFNF